MNRNIEDLMLINTCIGLIEEFAELVPDDESRAYLRNRMIFFQDVLQRLNLGENNSVSHHYGELRSLVENFLTAFDEDHRETRDTGVLYRSAAIASIRDRLASRAQAHQETLYG